jgi:hypothetical protein
MLLMHFRYCPLRLPTPGMQLYTIHAFRLTRDGHRTAYTSDAMEAEERHAARRPSSDRDIRNCIPDDCLPLAASAVSRPQESKNQIFEWSVAWH